MAGRRLATGTGRPIQPGRSHGHGHGRDDRSGAGAGCCDTGSRSTSRAGCRRSRWQNSAPIGHAGGHGGHHSSDGCQVRQSQRRRAEGADLFVGAGAGGGRRIYFECDAVCFSGTRVEGAWVCAAIGGGPAQGTDARTCFHARPVGDDVGAGRSFDCPQSGGSPSRLGISAAITRVHGFHYRPAFPSRSEPRWYF